MLKSLILNRSSIGMLARQSQTLVHRPIVAGAAPIHNEILTKKYLERLGCRSFVSSSRILFADNSAVEKGVQNITDLFMTARDELEYAEEARGTVYYNDDKETARSAVQECLTTYDELLKDLDDAQKLDVQRKIGLKIMELKSQLDALNAEELE